MKPAFYSPLKLVMVLLAAGLTIGLVSWGHKQNPGNKYQQPQTDTVPQKEKKTKDLDEVFDDEDHINFNIDMEKMQKELAEALKNIDVDKIKLEVEKALKDVDMAKLQAEVKEALAKVDFEKIKKEVSNALKEVDVAKIQAEVKASLEKINWDDIKLEIEKVKDADMKKLEKELEKVREELKDLKPKLEKELEKAKVEMEKAKATLAEYRDFTNGLENDGLINKKEGYTLKHKDGELFINGKKASAGTYNKYSDFLNKNKKFSIDRDDSNGFNIGND
jgi:predicted ribosome quality control (RQC) complex YloA/Tae2 family protein